jgi:outer membrane protein assembly factor BamB
VVLSHGDVVLLRAPLDSMPTECYFEGKATFYGIEAVRSEWPPDAVPGRPVVFDSDRPADLEWLEQLGEGSRFERHPDGTVELTAAKARQPAWVACPIPERGVGEVLLQVENATPGTGVFLGPGDARPAHAMRLLRDTNSGRMVAMLRDFDTRDTGFSPVQQAFVPFAPPSLWVRLLFACGTVHWWTSCDGVHWVAGDKHWGDLNEAATHFGLMHCGELAEGRIRLRRVQVRLLPEFNALADPELVRQATPWPRVNGIGSWLTNSMESMPPGVDADAWRRASAIRTLGHGCAKMLGTQLIDLLLDDAARRGLPLERRKALLAEAALLLTVRDDYAQRELLMERYHALGMEAFRREGQRPYTWIRHDLMSVPLGSHDDVRPARETLVRAEIIQLSHQQRWRELFDLCRQLWCFRLNDVTPLTEWAEAVALRYLPQDVSGDRLVRRKADWSPVWIEEVSKPTYNFLAELQAMIDSSAWDDAARLIVSLDAELLRGLAPDASDARRYVSLPTAVASAAEGAGPLRQAILDQYRDVADLRVRSAMQRGNAVALELATIQFSGTEAAAEAHRWLGDRALTGGWFATALVEYRRGLASAGSVLRGELEARQRLAAALQGQRMDGKAQSDVVFGEHRLSAEQFEQLIDELVSSRASLAPTAGEAATAATPQPTGYSVQRRGRLQGPVGKDAPSRPPMFAVRFNLDWVGRQLATALWDDTLYVSNRFHLSAHRLADGSRAWQAVPDRAAPLPAQEWPLIPMRPLVVRDRIYARMMYEPGPVLVCVDRTSGQVRWTTELGQGESVISDPVMIQGQLVALTVVRQDQGANLVRLTVFDAENGYVLTAFDLLRLNEVWWRRRCCETLAIDDSLIVAMSGVTFRCGLSGQVHWLRTQTALPPEEDPRWVAQYFQRPLQRGGLVYIAQPGVASVDCLDASTGRLVWSRVLPDLQRVFGLVDDLLIVQTDNELLAVEADTGHIRWEHRLPGILHGMICDSSGILFAQPAASRRLARKEGCHLVWLDAASGDALAVSPLGDLNTPETCLGPLTLWKDRIWTFYGANRNDLEPEILELVPAGSGDLAWDPAVEPDPWTRHVPLDLLRTAAKRFPGWQLISGTIDRTGPIEAERQGRTNVLVAHAKPNEPVVFTRDIAVPVTGQPRLRFTLGHTGVRDWSIEVRLGDEVLLRDESSGRSLREPWKTIEVDLAPAAGRRGPLIIKADLTGGGESLELFWDSIEIVY